jgi:DNA polymerase-3 subunit gamma/tau
MSYLVLARKWRPKRFSELVGQEHVVRALSHALDSGRVHHAFLFTGTRGVGKTTIARIFAKSLNCETGIGAEPCGSCAVCTAVDAGRFVDLIEIDAASNTGVDDVREVIENAQYLPTRGRYKVYLVDEVHMLSRNAFNALLKTLEEPPEHVKFLLATTDPQKLPVTVLSRCLQFNLKRLTEEQIAAQIERILGAEEIAFDAKSVQLIARGADGSLRDGLSLLDQAIAHGSGALRGEDVAAMLGSVESGDIAPLIAALVAGDGAALHAAIGHLAGFSPDYGRLLEALAEAMHRVQLRQLVPAAADADDEAAILAAADLAPEQIQLWYQMAVQGKREIELAPSWRIGFEMVLLRMLAFQGIAEAPAPGTGGAGHGQGEGAAGGRAAAAAAIAKLGAAQARSAAPSPAAKPAPSMLASPAPAPAPASAVRESRPVAELAAPAALLASSASGAASGRSGAPDASLLAEPRAGTASRRIVLDNEDWLSLLSGISLSGPAGQLAAHAQFLGDDGDTLRLGLPEVHEHLKMPALQDRFANALADALGGPPRIAFGAPREARETLSQRSARERDARQLRAEAEFAADPIVQRLVNEFGARIVPDSVRPLDN